MKQFKLKAMFDAGDADSYIKCEVSTGDMDYLEAFNAMMRFRDHLTARIDAAPNECPLAINREKEAKAITHGEICVEKKLLQEQIKEYKMALERATWAATGHRAKADLKRIKAMEAK